MNVVAGMVTGLMAISVKHVSRILVKRIRTTHRAPFPRTETSKVELSKDASFGTG